MPSADPFCLEQCHSMGANPAPMFQPHCALQALRSPDDKHQPDSSYIKRVEHPVTLRLLRRRKGSRFGWRAGAHRTGVLLCLVQSPSASERQRLCMGVEIPIHAGDGLSGRTEIRLLAGELYSESKKKIKKSTRM